MKNAYTMLRFTKEIMQEEEERRKSAIEWKRENSNRGREIAKGGAPISPPPSLIRPHFSLYLSLLPLLPSPTPTSLQLDHATGKSVGDLIPTWSAYSWAANS
jgi:hypothetical protein